MKWVAFCGHELNKFDNFKDAMQAVFEEVKNRGSLSNQFLETCCWVVSDQEEGDLPIMFYTLRDIACDLGFVKNGEWVKPPSPYMTGKEISELWNEINRLSQLIQDYSSIRVSGGLHFYAEALAENVSLLKIHCP